MYVCGCECMAIHMHIGMFVNEQLASGSYAIPELEQIHIFSTVLLSSGYLKTIFEK